MSVKLPTLVGSIPGSEIRSPYRRHALVGSELFQADVVHVKLYDDVFAEIVNDFSNWNFRVYMTTLGRGTYGAGSVIKLPLVR